MGLAFNRPSGLIAPTDRIDLWVGNGNVSPIRTFGRRRLRLSSDVPPAWVRAVAGDVVDLTGTTHVARDRADALPYGFVLGDAELVRGAT